MKQARRNRFFYGLGTVGRDMVYTLFSMYLMYYLTDVLTISDATMLGVTLVFMAMRIFDAFNDPFMGLIVDNTKSRFGKFKPWIAGGVLLAGVFTVFMFIDFGLQGGSFVLLFALIYLFWEVTYTANDIAYWSMLPALSRDQREREKIGSVARICANVGMFTLVVGIVPITDILTKVLGSEQRAYLALAVILVLVMWLFQFIMLALVKEEHVQVEVEKPTNIRDLFTTIFHNDQLLWTTVSMCLFMIAYTTTTSFGLYYFEYIFGDKDAYSVFALILGVSQIAALAAFPLFSKRFSRKSLYRSGTILVVAGYVIFYVAKESLITIAVAGILLFVGQAFIQLLMLMFISDCVEYGQLKLGRRNDSITLSLQPLINKVGGAAASGIVGLTVLWSGVKNARSAADMQPEGITLFKTAMLLLPLFLIALSYLIYAKKYVITEEKYAEIVAAIKAQEEAGPAEGSGL